MESEVKTMGKMSSMRGSRVLFRGMPIKMCNTPPSEHGKASRLLSLPVLLWLNSSDAVVAAEELFLQSTQSCNTVRSLC